MNGFTTLRSRAANSLKLRWSPRRVPFQSEYDVLSNEANPLYARVYDEWMRTPEDILRWKVVTNMSKKELPKTVLRTRLKRRWTEAFKQALRSRGFDNDGKP